MIVAVDDTRFQSKLVEESLFCLSKWAEIDDPALCSSVCERLTWIDFKTCENGRVSSSPVKRIDPLIHAQRFNVIVVALVLLIPTSRFPATRIPAILHMMFAPRAITAMVAFHSFDASQTSSNGLNASCRASSVLSANQCQ